MNGTPDCLEAPVVVDDQPTVRHARRVVAGALALGVFVQALFWRTWVGVNWLFLIVTLVVASFLMFDKRPVRTPAVVAAGAAVVLATLVVLRAGVFTAVVAIPLSALLVAILPLLLRSGASLAEIGRLPVEILQTLRGTPEAVRATVELPGQALAGDGRGGAMALLRGIVVGLPITAIFASLLSSDEKFAALLGHGAAEISEWIFFGGASLVTAAAAALAYGLERHARAVGGTSGARDRFLPYVFPYRAPDATAPAARTVSGLTPFTWGFVVTQVTVVFAVFVLANASDLFGGHGVVRAANGPSYASHLHSGFAQLLVATVLSICLVLAGHALLRPKGTSGAPRGGIVLGILECALLLLTAVTLASCWQRLAVYEDAYGATHLRLGVALIQVAVVIALALTALKSIARKWNGYVGAAFVFIVLLGIGASAFNADAYVARTNLDRAERGKALDAVYLATLSPDAADALDHSLFEDHRWLRSALLEQFERYYAERDLRSFRGAMTRLEIANELDREISR